MTPEYFERALRILSLGNRSMSYRYSGREQRRYPRRQSLLPPVPELTPANYYLEAMPRFAQIVVTPDINTFGTRRVAGTFLSELNSTQREIPAFFRPAPAPGPPRRRFAFETLRADYARRFRALVVRAEFIGRVRWHLAMIRRSRPRYERVAADLGLPWYVVACIHALEGSFNFLGHLHNGDPLRARTTRVPANRPNPWLPPSDWESSARDAIHLMNFDGLADWSLERTLHRFEAYNGFGYRRRAVPSPYLWSFSTHYDRGKFRADGAWDPALRSQQCGAAVMLKALIDAGQIDLAPSVQEHAG